ncbi:hypothetical protein [Butyrivibrio proteoclasticus]|uniref:hypothetical protein n=1 Tax=Butyrivibrio proteoclasticus TaxID=43305 RepID=UPI0004789006|nr:hypothetical protein [Butyrivibrio proteoclasticus]
MQTEKTINISCSKHIDKQEIYHLFKKILSFVDSPKFKAKHFANGRCHKYNENKFSKAFYEEMSVTDDDIRFTLEWPNGKASIICYKVDVAYRIRVSIDESADVRIQQELENFIIKNAIMAGEADVHDMAIQNQRYIHMLEWLGEKPDDYPKCKGNTEEYEIDISKNPGYWVVARGMDFAAFYRMWFGKDAYKLFDKDVLREFPCYENVILDNDVTRITLYQNILEYKKKENRDKQWEFREKTHLDKIAAQIKKDEEDERNRLLDP